MLNCALEPGTLTPEPGIRAKIINTRVKHLHDEIRNFESWITRLKMEVKVEVKIADLRSIANKLFDHLEQHENSMLTIESDFYWYIPQDKLYDSYDEPREFSQGQLFDDWNELQSTLKGEKEPIGYALVWLAAILRKIGENTTA